jgi:cell division protein FtsB
MNDTFYRRDRRKRIRRYFGSKRFIVAISAGLLVMGYVLLGDHGIIQRIRLEHEKSGLETRIKAAEEENLKLQAEIKALEHDMEAVEKVAREKYWMAREGETVYRVKTSEQQAASTQ